MATLIDGYNLLHGTDLFGRGRNAGTLEASREALIRFVLDALEPGELTETTIVFDSKDAPPGLPRALSRQGLSIRFASGYSSADELLEELIAADNAPKKLIVVSSDHQVQRAARRRRARPIDSHDWYFHMRQRPSRPDHAASDAKPEGPYSSEEVAFFVRQFQMPPEPDGPDGRPEIDQAEESAESIEPAAQGPEPLSPPSQSRIAAKSPRGPKPGRPKTPVEADEKPMNLRNPFPPGYAEDVLEED